MQTSLPCKDQDKHQISQTRYSRSPSSRQDFLQHQSNSQSDPSQVEYRNAMWNFLSAALRGHKEAQYRLGTGYLNGELGLPKNFSLAEFWLKKSADQGYSPANTALQKSYEEIVFS